MSESDDLARKATDLRLAGLGYQQIATQLGYENAAAAAAAVQGALHQEIEESPELIRAQEIERLDAMMLGLWPKARRGDSAAIDRVLRLSAQRARSQSDGLDDASSEDAQTSKALYCEECGKNLEGRSPRTRFCDSKCRGKANRQPGKIGTYKAATGAGESDLPKKPEYTTLADQLTVSLTEAQALDTIAGMAALRIAQQIDRGRDTGSAVATLSKELSRLVDEAKLEAAPKIRDRADLIMEAAGEKMLRLVK